MERPIIPNKHDKGMQIVHCTNKCLLYQIWWQLNFTTVGAPRGFGDLGRMAFYFQGAGSNGNYLRGAREQAHNFGDLGSLAKKQKINK